MHSDQLRRCIFQFGLGLHTPDSSTGFAVLTLFFCFHFAKNNNFASPAPRRIVDVCADLIYNSDQQSHKPMILFILK